MEDIFSVVATGDTNVLKKSISEETNINVVDRRRHSRTPLHVAVIQENIKAVEELLDNKANIDPLDRNKNTPLHFAAKHDSFKIAQILIKNGANVYAVNNDGEAPIDKEFIKIIHQHNIDGNSLKHTVKDNPNQKYTEALKNVLEHHFGINLDLPKTPAFTAPIEPRKKRSTYPKIQCSNRSPNENKRPKLVHS